MIVGSNPAIGATIAINSAASSLPPAIDHQGTGRAKKKPSRPSARSREITDPPISKAIPQAAVTAAIVASGRAETST
jgi:hypothetical protein